MGENGGFERGNFGHGFDDEVGGGEIGHLSRGSEAGADGGGFIFSNSLFGDILLEEFVCTRYLVSFLEHCFDWRTCELETFIYRGLRAVDKRDWDLSFLSRNKRYT